MAFVISFVQRKGGVGKTTLAMSVAAELRRRNAPLAVIDADPQASASAWAELGHLDFPVYQIGLADNPVQAWAETVMKVPHHCLVIDTSPNERSVAAALAISNIGMIPCTPSGLDIDATIKTLDIVRAVRARRGPILKTAIVPNRVDTRTLEGRQIIDELQDLGEPIAPAVGARTAFLRAFSAGQSVFEQLPGGSADQDIKRLCTFLDTEFAPQKAEVRPTSLVG
ncbi:nucleotide-binding protein [Terrihabitans sp. B22-R8]|uniref:nucleotide-binding protein n=1 Tax=Terrihabitans sp. B22-R8 TaxID=3425128 RepID=UPI00403D1329